MKTDKNYEMPKVRFTGAVQIRYECEMCKFIFILIYMEKYRLKRLTTYYFTDSVRQNVTVDRASNDLEPYRLTVNRERSTE